MALFENVNFEYYTETLGRQIVPTLEEFNKYKLENELCIKELVSNNLLIERELDGISKAVCMMIEEDYKVTEILNGNSAPESSESVNGYSYSKDMTHQNKTVELNAKSLDQKKYKWIRAFCDIGGKW